MAKAAEITNFEAFPESEFQVNVVLPGGQVELKSVHIMDEHGTDFTVAQVKETILSTSGITNAGDYAALFVNSIESRLLPDNDPITDHIQYLASGYQLEFHPKL
ncbi:unnamed protein product [Lymnaea stagnalis]|uniref:Uncharacterized protein n=1 Tax=Lymnaea stagnalis TaxID=6523 RepID=A0AAV2H8K1_LYMST